MRVGIAWFERLIVMGRDVDAREDISDWLAGHEHAVTQRRNDRALDAIAMAGGRVR